MAGTADGHQVGEVEGQVWSLAGRDDVVDLLSWPVTAPTTARTPRFPAEASPSTTRPLTTLYGSVSAAPSTTADRDEPTAVDAGRLRLHQTAGMSGSCEAW